MSVPAAKHAAPTWMRVWWEGARTIIPIVATCAAGMALEVWCLTYHFKATIYASGIGLAVLVLIVWPYSYGKSRL